MDWATDAAPFDWHSCSSDTCQDECSKDSCAQLCDGSSICESASVCMNDDCTGTVCMSSCSSGLAPCLSLGAKDAEPIAHEPMWQEDSAGDHRESIHCPWILPGAPCDVTVGTRNALGRHIYEKHIDPQLTLKCPLDNCAEIVRKSHLPNHQAQQHQLENYLCSWDNCADTYPSSDDLFNHIMASHGDLDCHFGGCEVSLKDPRELQNHVVEDHLDHNLDWSDNPMFDQHHPVHGGYGFESLSTVIPRTEDYEYRGEGGQLQYYEPACSNPPCHGPIASNVHPFAVPSLQTPHQQMHHHTYADKVEAVWRNSRPFHQPKPDLPEGDANLVNNSSASYTASTPSSEQGSPRTAHVCKWIIGLRDHKLCDRVYDTAGDLQEHLREDHCKQRKVSRSAPKIQPICHWEGCGRFGEPLNDTHKLIRHALTHSECTRGWPPLW